MREYADNTTSKFPQLISPGRPCHWQHLTEHCTAVPITTGGVAVKEMALKRLPAVPQCDTQRLSLRLSVSVTAHPTLSHCRQITAGTMSCTGSTSQSLRHAGSELLEATSGPRRRGSILGLVGPAQTMSEGLGFAPSPSLLKSIDS